MILDITMEKERTESAKTSVTTHCRLGKQSNSIQARLPNILISAWLVFFCFLSRRVSSVRKQCTHAPWQMGVGGAAGEGGGRAKGVVVHKQRSAYKSFLPDPLLSDPGISS